MISSEKEWKRVRMCMKKNCSKYYEIFNLILNILLHFQFLRREIFRSF